MSSGEKIFNINNNNNQIKRKKDMEIKEEKINILRRVRLFKSK